ncbi:MAG: signal peptide peptidase SppA [candidate division Zixibacteria bacterium]|nr:signal peptide peptidase SppA [candidate division Zixibacteria bacterium]
MAKKRDIIIAFVIVGSVVVFGLLMIVAIFGAFSNDDVDFAGFGDKIGVIDVHGSIFESRSVIRQLQRYLDSDNIPAVLLHIDSPGGGVVPSMEIYEEILKAREDGLVVVADFASVGASGAYLIACACDTIVANQGTITGSIGTVLSYPVADELMDKIGIKYEVIKSGKYKDVGNFARPVYRYEREMLQNLIDDSYRQFTEIVSENRGLPIEDVLEISQGQVYTGSQALDLGLVDVLGTYYDALDITAEMVGMEENPKTVKERKRKPSFLDVITEGLTTIKGLTESESSSIKLEYIYR